MTTQTQAPPEEALLQLITGYWATQIATTAARLNIFEHLPGPAAELASRLELNPDGLHRLLRGCCAVGLAQEPRPGHFEPTELGRMLTGDHPHSLKAMAIMLADPGHWDCWSRLEQSVRTGTHTVPAEHGSIFEYFVAHPREGERFNQAMGSMSAAFAEAVGTVYDFTPYRVIADVGGSHGVLLRAALRQAPESWGLLFDQPQVLATAPELERVTQVPGNFFESAPSGADLYLLKHILHDWSDEECVAILKNIRAAMSANSRLLVVETLLADKAGRADLLDLNMLVLTTGRERSAAQYEGLLNRAGLNLLRVLPTPGLYSLLEAGP